LHDALVENPSWVDALSKIEVIDPQAAGRSLPANANVLHRVAAAVMRASGPLARRSLTGVSARLPAGVRGRLNRMLSPAGPDMRHIERDYAAWIRLYDRTDAESRRSIVAEIARMAHPPLISVLMPVFNPSPKHLLAAIHSVRDQYYPWWELCISDDASTNPIVMDILRKAAASDHRIRLVQRERNGHISAASNSALRLATGSFVALLDHDDVLPPNALFEVAARIEAQPDVDILYSDEDHIDNEGQRSHPYFKPDWNPELILGQNLISHLGVYRRTLIERIDGFRMGFEGSQDHDLALRMIALTRPDRIAHIPKVLYHWRQKASGRSFSEAALERCVTNGRRAVHEFVAREAPGVRVAPAPAVPSWYRVIFPVPAPAPLVSVVLPCFDSTSHALLDSIDDLLDRTDYPALEVLVPAEAPALPHGSIRDPRVRFIGRHAAPCIKAAQQARGSLLLLLNANLAAGEAGWLREMVSQALRPDVGAVGAKLLGPDGTVRHAGVAIGGRSVVFLPFAGQRPGDAGYFGYLRLARDVSAVSGACMLIRRDVFLQHDGFDEALVVPTFKDVDLCLKLAESGYRTVWTPHAEMFFRDEATPLHGDAARFKRAIARLRQRWGRRLEYDPYWSPNLAHESGEPRLAFPPRAAGQVNLVATGAANIRRSRQTAQTGAAHIPA
jgi:O-antigen biosynthesis protein